MDLERPILFGISFTQLSTVDSNSLTAPFSVEEIKEAIWSCGGNKSPGLDHFKFDFFRSCWEVIGGEVEGLVQFFGHGKLPKAVTSSFIAMIPKK